MKDLYPQNEAMLLETISQLSGQVYAYDRDKVSYADYQHSCLLLEMIDELEVQLEEISLNG